MGPALHPLGSASALHTLPTPSFILAHLEVGAREMGSDKTSKERQSAFSLPRALSGSLLLLVVLGRGRHPQALYSEGSYRVFGEPSEIFCTDGVPENDAALLTSSSPPSQP